VFIESEWYTQITAPQDDELELLEETESYQANHSRLSCQVEFTAAFAGIRLTIAPEE
jgi:2Fe-2S ferredoxin